MKKEVQNAIETLSKLDLSSYPYYEITRQIENLGNIGLLEVTYNPGKLIYRARLNDGEESFFSKCQLSYKPQQLNKTCQRASTPNMTMFYGSVLPEDIETGDLEEVRLVPTYEGVPWLRDKKTTGKKRITYSKWSVIGEIKLIAVLQHGEFYNKHSYTKKLMDDFQDFLKYKDENQEETEAFTTYIAGEFAKEVDSQKDYDYLISAAFTESIVRKGYDGILYPSVQLDGEGFNIALTPKAVDQKLQLDFVLECIAYKNQEKTILDNYFHAEIYPNQTNFEMKEVEDEYRFGESECLKQIDIKSLDELK